MCHAGLILPYALPSEYPFPLFVGGTVGTPNYNYQSTSFCFSFWAHKTTSVSILRGRDGVWYEDNGLTGDNRFGCWPWGIESSTFSRLDLKGARDGSFPIISGILTGEGNGGNNYGEWQGVYYIPSFNIAPNTPCQYGDIIQIGGKDYLVVQDVGRNNRNDHAAFLLE